jgi:7-cyano-7-deazaguanine synthase in queuosine biosynthesis
VLVPSHRDAFTRQEEGWRVRSGEALEGIVWQVARREVEFVRPLAGMGKTDIWRALPGELREVCWWCREPQGDRPCWRCMTCRQVARAKRER